jgi:CO/xanthine dehydrogenase FAD-binding subunit
MSWTVKVYRPDTLKDACTVLAEPSIRIFNGGTCFSLAANDRPVLSPILDLSRLKELKAIQIADDEVRIGGRITWSETAVAELPPCFDALKQAAQKVGSVQIQSVATIAGNLCNASSTADGVPPLLALDAEVELESSAGQRRIGLLDFIVGDRKALRRNDEILTAIVVPRTIDAGASVFFKLEARSFLATSIVAVAAIIEQDATACAKQVRVAVDSCSPVAQRLRNLEGRLVGKPIEPGLGDVAEEGDLAALSPVDDVQATASYRRAAALTLVRRAINGCVGVR